MQNDLQFWWHKPALIFHLHQVYANLYLDRCWNSVPWHSQELYSAKWLMKHRFISEQCAVRLIQPTWNSEQFYFFTILNRPAGIEFSDSSIRWMYINIFRLTCVKLRIWLENFKGVFARTCVVSDDLSFTLVEMDKNYSLTVPRWKSLCHRLSCDQLQPGSFSQRPREAEEREAGNEVVVLRIFLAVKVSFRVHSKK